MGDQISATEVGSIIANSREKVSAFCRQHYPVFRKLLSLSHSRSLVFADDDEQIRVMAASMFFESSLRDSLYSVNLFRDGFDTVFRKNQNFEENSAKDGLLQCVHIHADSIPIDLFNAFKITQSAEFVKLSKQSAKNHADCFLAHFPRVVDARDSITHYHDRAFGRFRDTQFSGRLGSSRIYSYGKIFVDAKGLEFDFDFDEAIFARYLDDLDKAVA
jgi:hypothetical protein